jgi:Asp-tRNA(Asn)/Glu-tRNA(Gln) amidotransferase A subunit family amidase
MPCVTLPAVWGDSGLPTGVQLVGPIGRDPEVLACAVFAERALAAAL